MTIIILKCILSIICYPVKCGFLIPTQAADFLIFNGTALKHFCDFMAWMSLAVHFQPKTGISTVLFVSLLSKECWNSLQRIIIDKVLKTDYIFSSSGKIFPVIL